MTKIGGNSQFMSNSYLSHLQYKEFSIDEDEEEKDKGNMNPWDLEFKGMKLVKKKPVKNQKST